MRPIVVCSCGWNLLGTGHVAADQAGVRMSIATMVSHWRGGHAVRAADLATYLMIRGAATDLAASVNRARTTVVFRHPKKRTRGTKIEWKDFDWSGR